MGTTGIGIRNQMRNVIGNKNIRTSVTLTPIIRTKGADGGHDAVTETDGTPRTVYAVLTNNMADLIQLVKFGDLRTGEVNLVIRDDETADTNDKVTYNSSDYNIRNIEKITINEIDVCQVLVLSERLG